MRFKPPGLTREATNQIGVALFAWGRGHARE